MYKIGVIGLGLRMGMVFHNILRLGNGEITLSAITEMKTKEQLLTEHETFREQIEKANLYSSPEEMLENEKLDGIMIGTRCSLHAKLAALVIKKRIPLFLEKPIATTMEDWRMLHDIYENHDDKIVVSFPLKVSPLVGLVKEIVDSGRIGTIEHVQAYNYVPYGGVYYHSWYRDESETGGLFLQKATHDFDYINYIVGNKPIEICAMGSKQIFKGNKPAGLKCKDCHEYYTCLESPYMMEHVYSEDLQGDFCCFAEDTGNHDSATAIVRYDTGMHMSYTQNFFARKQSAKRGAVFSGYDGTVEFDWYKDEIKVFRHHVSSVEVHKFNDPKVGHFGGDDKLIMNFIDVVKGRDTSISSLKDGLVSVLMCLLAKESEESHRFMEIKY